MKTSNKSARISKLRDLFEERKQLEQHFPELRPSFEQFLKDFREYELMRQSLDLTPAIEHYILYGARYGGGE